MVLFVDISGETAVPGDEPFQLAGMRTPPAV